VEPDDEAGLAAALTEVLADPGERARRAVAARADALARFSWPALGARLADVLDVVARRGATSAAGPRP
jgi:glycosyltransferase involved in cell wall biosynthesis